MIENRFSREVLNDSELEIDINFAVRPFNIYIPWTKLLNSSNKKLFWRKTISLGSGVPLTSLTLAQMIIKFELLLWNGFFVSGSAVNEKPQKWLHEQGLDYWIQD